METENHEQEIITMFKYLKIPLEAKYAPNRLTAEKAINSGYIYRDRLGYRFKYRLPDITTEELRELKELYSDAKKAQEKKQRSKKETKVSSDGHSSFASKCFFVMAWILWIGGLIASIGLSYKDTIVEKSNYCGKYYYETVTEFDWVSFLIFASIYAVAGIFCLCINEVNETLNATECYTKFIAENTEIK